MPNLDYPADFRGYIQSLTRFLLKILNHTEYRVTFRFQSEPNREDAGSCTSTWMQILVNGTYLWATIDIYPRSLEAWNDKEYDFLGNSLLHEVCHLLTHPIAQNAMYDAAPSQQTPFRDITERQTQRIANVIAALLPENWYLPSPSGE
jgi:hypothetical protein